MSCVNCGTTFSQDVDDDVQCPRAKILTCLHILCSVCLAQLIQVVPEENAVVTICPLCSEPTIKPLPADYSQELDASVSRSCSYDSDMSLSHVDTTPTQYFPSQMESKYGGEEQNLDTSVYSDLPDELLDMYNEGDEAPHYEDIYIQTDHINDSTELDNDDDIYSQDDDQRSHQSVHSEARETAISEQSATTKSELVALAHWTLVFIDLIIIISVCIYRFIGDSIFADNSVIQIRASAETQSMVCALLLTHLLLQEMPSSSLFTVHNQMVEATTEDNIVSVMLVAADVAAVVALLVAAVGSTVYLTCQIIAQEALNYLHLPNISTTDVVMGSAAMAMISSALYHALYEDHPDNAPESTYSSPSAKLFSTRTPGPTPSSTGTRTSKPVAPVFRSPPVSSSGVKASTSNTKANISTSVDAATQRYISPEPRRGIDTNRDSTPTTRTTPSNLSPMLTPMDNPLRKASVRLPARASTFATECASADVEYADIYGGRASSASKVRSATPPLDEVLPRDVYEGASATAAVLQQAAHQASLQAAKQATTRKEAQQLSLAQQWAQQRAAEQARQQAHKQALKQAQLQEEAQALAQALAEQREQALEQARLQAQAQEHAREQERAVKEASERLAEQLARSARPPVLSPPRSIHRADRHTPSEEQGSSEVHISAHKPNAVSAPVTADEHASRIASPVPAESAESKLFARVDTTADTVSFEQSSVKSHHQQESQTATEVTSSIHRTMGPSISAHEFTATYSPLQSFPQATIASMALSPCSPLVDDVTPDAGVTGTVNIAPGVSAFASMDSDPGDSVLQRQFGSSMSTATESAHDLLGARSIALQRSSVFGRDSSCLLDGTSAELTQDSSLRVPSEPAEHSESNPIASIEVASVSSGTPLAAVVTAESNQLGEGAAEDQEGNEHEESFEVEETAEQAPTPTRSKFQVANPGRRKKGLRKFKSMYAYSPPTSSPAKAALSPAAQAVTTPAGSASKDKSKRKSGDKKAGPAVSPNGSGPGSALKRLDSIVSKDSSLGSISTYSTMGGSSLNSSCNNINSVYSAAASVPAPSSSQKAKFAVTANDGVESVASGDSKSKRSKGSPQSVRAARRAAAEGSTPQSSKRASPATLPSTQLRSPESSVYLHAYEVKKLMSSDAGAPLEVSAGAECALQAALDSSALEASFDLVECMRTQSGDEVYVTSTLFTGAGGRAVLPAPRRDQRSGQRVAVRRFSESYDSDTSQHSDTTYCSTPARYDSEGESIAVPVRVPRTRGEPAAGAHSMSRSQLLRGLQQVVPEPPGLLPEPVGLDEHAERGHVMVSGIALQSYTEPPSPAVVASTEATSLADSSEVPSPAADANVPAHAEVQVQVQVADEVNVLDTECAPDAPLFIALVTEESELYQEVLTMETTSHDDASPTSADASATENGTEFIENETEGESSGALSGTPVLSEPSKASFVRSSPVAGGGVAEEGSADGGYSEPYEPVEQDITESTTAADESGNHAAPIIEHIVVIESVAVSSEATSGESSDPGGVTQALQETVQAVVTASEQAVLEAPEPSQEAVEALLHRAASVASDAALQESPGIADTSVAVPSEGNTLIEPELLGLAASSPPAVEPEPADLNESFEEIYDDVKVEAQVEVTIEVEVEVDVTPEGAVHQGEPSEQVSATNASDSSCAEAEAEVDTASSPDLDDASAQSNTPSLAEKSTPAHPEQDQERQVAIASTATATIVEAIGDKDNFTPEPEVAIVLEYVVSIVQSTAELVATQGAAAVSAVIVNEVIQTPVANPELPSSPSSMVRFHVPVDINAELANEQSLTASPPQESPDTIVTTYRDDTDTPETPHEARMRIDVSISPDGDMSQITAPSPMPVSILSLSQLAAPTPSPLKQSPLYMNLPISPYNYVTGNVGSGPPSRASNSSSFAAGGSGSRSKSNIRASIEERVYARMRRKSTNNMPGSANSADERGDGARSVEPSPGDADSLAVSTLNTPDDVDRFEKEMHALYSEYLPTGSAGASGGASGNSAARAQSVGRSSISPLDTSAGRNTGTTSTVSPKPNVEMVHIGTSPIRVLQQQGADHKTVDGALNNQPNFVVPNKQISVSAAIAAEFAEETPPVVTRNPERPSAALHRSHTVAALSPPASANNTTTSVRQGSMFLKSPDQPLSAGGTPTKLSVPSVISKATVSSGAVKGKLSPVTTSVQGSVTPVGLKKSSTAAPGSSTLMAMRSVGTVGTVGTAGSAQSVSSAASNGTPKSLSRAASSLDCVADTMDTSSCYVVMVHMNQSLTSHRCVGKIAKCIASVVGKCQQRQCPVAVAVSTPLSPPNVPYWLYAVPNSRTGVSVSSLTAAFQSPASPLSASGGSVGSATSPDAAVEYVIKAKTKACFLLPKRGDSAVDVQLTERMYRTALSGLVSQEASAVTHLHAHHVGGDLKAGFEDHLLNLRAEIKLALSTITGTTDIVVVCDSQTWPFHAPPELASQSHALAKWSTFRSKVPFLQFHFVAINTLSSAASTASLLSVK